MRVKKVVLCLITMIMMLNFNGINVMAEFRSASDTRAVMFIIGTDIGPQPFAVTHKYFYDETYTKGGSYIRYTTHRTCSWLEGWTGSAFGSVVNYNCHQAYFYDSAGNYIKSANIKRDTDMMWAPYQEQYESATGTDIATVNTSWSTAKAKFMVVCYEAMYAPSDVDVELICD